MDVLDFRGGILISRARSSQIQHGSASSKLIFFLAVLQDLVPIANCIRNDDLNLWERDIKLIELHSLILITLRNIGKKSDEFLTFKNAAKPHNVSVDLYDLHFVQAIQILIGLDGRPEGTQKIEKLLGEKDHKDLENLTGSLRSYCRTNGRNSEYAFFRTKAQLWSPVLWFWFVRSSLHTLTAF